MKNFIFVIFKQPCYLHPVENGIKAGLFGQLLTTFDSDSNGRKTGEFYF